ncbi:MAG TPA: Slp family lipoprotein [Desulfatiglandales bacterium]|nr:Slp family lipoprotein [Desulfatiglandales bacterium]
MKTIKCTWPSVWLLTTAALAVAGCAAVISQESLKTVDQGIGFEQVLENPDAYRGKVVLLGGEIIKTENLPNKTVIIVLQRSLGYRQEPTSEGESKGRFIVSAPGFLDPAIYRPRRKITVVGSVMGKEVRPLGELEYTYPIIEKKELYIWPPEGAPTTTPRFHIGIGIGKTL